MALIFALTSMIPMLAHSQPPRIDARLIPDSVAIGDRFTLEVTVDKDLMQVVDLPSFENGMFSREIDIVEEGAVDTLAREGRRLKLGKNYVLTTFEEGVHAIGRFPMIYYDKNIVDTLLSADSLVLQVGTFPIDTATMTIRDIRPVEGAPLKAGEFLGYLSIGLLAAILAAGLIWWLVRMWRRRPASHAAENDEPPHVAAIGALEALHAQKLWQNNRHKLYYTRLTDILRQYIEGRWGVAAMEMTTDEIMSAMSGRGVGKASLDGLRGVLRSADLVKFAKFTPQPDENETAYTKSYYFVENTKPAEERADNDR